MMIKDKIRQAFNKAADSYDSADTIQSIVCDELIQALSEHSVKPESLLDLGCGTGNSTAKLLSSFDCQKLYALDLAEKLIVKAQSKISDTRVQFIVGDFEEPLFLEKKFDLIFSNMSLQWSLNLPKTISLLLQSLNPQGVLAFSLPLERTFCELKSDYRNSFLSLESIEAILDRGNLKKLSLHTKIHKAFFTSPLAALQSIKAVGATCLVSDKAGATLTTQAGLSSKFEAGWDNALSYQVGYFLVRKEE